MSDKKQFVLDVQQVSKRFTRSIKRAMWYGLLDIARISLIPNKYKSPSFNTRLNDINADVSLTGSPVLPELRESEFWALKDVSFKVKRGECLGLIGHNGAGKSTLLSLLSGIYGPTVGRITVRGRMQSLIALGAGFHPRLSGRENIYINAAILGLKARQIDTILDKVIEYSELGDFIDAPLKTYSSGMLVRLGFSVAVHLDPQILLVDEVLAVGDLSFQAKCIATMNTLIKGDKTILFVSHSPARIEAVSDRVMWLDHGQVRAIGDSGEVCAAYVTSQRSKMRTQTESKKAVGSRIVDLLKVECGSPGDDKIGEIEWGQPARFRIHYKCSQRVENAYFQGAINDAEGRRITIFSMMLDGHCVDLEKGPGSIDCLVDAMYLSPGTYDIILTVRGCSGAAFLADEGKYGEFTVQVPATKQFSGPMAMSLATRAGGVLLPYHWQGPH